MNCGCGAKSDGLSGFQLVPLGVVQHCWVAGLPDLQRLGRPRGRRAEHAVCMRKCCLIQCCLNAMQNHIPFVVRDVAASLVPFVYRYQHTPRSRSSCQLLVDRLMKASNRVLHHFVSGFQAGGKHAESMLTAVQLAATCTWLG